MSIKKIKTKIKIKTKTKIKNPEIKKQVQQYKARLKKAVKKVLSKKSATPVKKGKIVSREIIRPDMIIADVIEKYPEAIRVFFEYGITCVGCFLASDETIEQGISAHGIDVKKFLKDLNAAVQDSL